MRRLEAGILVAGVRSFTLFRTQSTIRQVRKKNETKQGDFALDIIPILIQRVIFLGFARTVAHCSVRLCHRLDIFAAAPHVRCKHTVPQFDPVTPTNQLHGAHCPIGHNRNRSCGGGKFALTEVFALPPYTGCFPFARPRFKCQNRGPTSVCQNWKPSISISGVF